jgi:integrase/recombinase XerC
MRIHRRRWTAVQPDPIMATMQLELVLKPTARPAVGPPPAAPARLRLPPVLELVEAFLRSIANPGTRRAYRPHLVNAIAAMRIADIGQITPARLAALRALVVTSNVSTSRQAQALCALRSFLSWCSLIETLPHLSLDSARQILRLPRVRTISVPQIPADDELPALFARAPIANGTRAMLAVFLGAGLREAELCALERGDLHVNGDGSGLLLVRGKGEKDRLVPIHPPVVGAIAGYLEASGRASAPSAAPIFVAHDAGAGSRGGAALSTRSVRRRIGHLLRAAGFARRVTVHSLRHKFATAMLEDGVDLKRIQDILGHASLATTQRYVDHISSRWLRAAVPARLVPGEAQPPQGSPELGR